MLPYKGMEVWLQDPSQPIYGHMIGFSEALGHLFCRKCHEIFGDWGTNTQCTA
jgi:hypothetical protein